MDIQAKLENSLKDALRAGDDVRKRTIRMALTAIRQAEVDRQVKLDEAGVLAILQKEVKTRQETIEEAKKANRSDLVAAAEDEIAVLQNFLPQALGPVELQKLAETAIAEVGAESLADLGKVMKVLMPRVAGRSSGDQVSQAVRQLLQK